MPDPDRFQLLLAWALPVLFAITVHEVAHGWVARYFGDPTAAMKGRLTLNPLRHIDPMGTVVVPTVMVLLSGFLFGWAKPVPVSPHYFPEPKRRYMAVVAVAGPFVNLVMAIGWTIGLKLVVVSGGDGSLARFLLLMCVGGVLINLILMILNLLPIPPLDGSRVMNAFLPESGARLVDRVEPYGLILLVVLLISGVLGGVLMPMMAGAESLLFGLAGLSGLSFLGGGS